ncbi:MAG: class II glutamine amidotransferase [Halieaceae bacterium]
MCRWLAYSGGSIPLGELIFNTRHSLIDQSLHARQGPNTTNGDGFGVGWYGQMETPGLYKNVQPAWNDSNLHDLCTHVSSPLFMAHIRASTGSPIQYTNCHPFRYENWLFVHNGVIKEFPRLRRRLLAALDDEYFPALAGSTDSEVMFLLALHFGLRDNVWQGVARMAGFIEQQGKAVGIEFPLHMTLGISDGKHIYAFRYSSEGETRTLFHSKDLGAIEEQLTPEQQVLLDQFTEDARCVVSEPLSDDMGLWEPIPESSFVSICDGEVDVQPFTPISP